MKKTTRFVLNLFKGNKKQLIAIILVATFGALFTVVTPYIYGRLFDLAMVPETGINILFSLIGLWLFLSLLSNYVSNRTEFMGEILSTKVALETEADAYSHFLTLPILFHKKE